MILAAIVAATLVVPASLERVVPPSPDQKANLPTSRQVAALRPLINSATECIARKVSADPRFAMVTQGAGLNELIVDSVPACLAPLRAMIDAYDGLFGDGAGEEFFMGRYLDELPAAVTARVRDSR
jgi:hypothetical protein